MHTFHLQSKYAKSHSGNPITHMSPLFTIFSSSCESNRIPHTTLCYKQYWTALSLHHMLTERHITLPFITVKHSPVTRLQLTYSFCGHLLWHF